MYQPPLLTPAPPPGQGIIGRGSRQGGGVLDHPLPPWGQAIKQPPHPQASFPYFQNPRKISEANSLRCHLPPYGSKYWLLPPFSHRNVHKVLSCHHGVHARIKQSSSASKTVSKCDLGWFDRDNCPSASRCSEKLGAKEGGGRGCPRPPTPWFEGGHRPSLPHPP